MICRILMSVMAFSSLALAVDVDKLGKQCAAGDSKACSKLVEIAKGSKNPDERKRAAEALVNEQLLADLARSASDRTVRSIAAGKLTNQAVLADIVRFDSNFQVRLMAIRNLKDQSLLDQVARSDSDRMARLAAVATMTDQVLLTNLLKTSSDSDLRQAAVVKITDQALLDQVARTETDPLVRAAAVAASSDESFLATAASDGNRTVRIAAAGRLEDLAIERIKREGPGKRLVIKEIVPGESEKDKGRICFLGDEKSGLRIGQLYRGDGLGIVIGTLKVRQEQIAIPAGARGSVHRFLFR